MGTFFAYTLYSGVFLLLSYLLYNIFLSREKLIALNRAVILGCYVVAFAAWPLSHIEWLPTTDNITMSDHGLDNVVMGINPVTEMSHRPSVWLHVILWIYLVGAVAVLLRTIYSAARLMLYIGKGEFIRKAGYRIIVMPGSLTAPFSFGHYIVMSEADYATVCETVVAHELAHIRCRHYLDLILAQTVCVLLWYNPASWLMRDELKLLHEYQADSEVLNGGVDEKEYQMLLIRKTVGNRFHALANNLNHSKLKNRITMMQKEKSRGVRCLRLALLAIAPVAALAVVNIPAVAGSMKSLEAASLYAVRPVESMGTHSYAEYPGGTDKLMEYLALNVRYPESAQKENIQGRPIVGFTVSADGTLIDIRILKDVSPVLDEEALRVVRKMPKWTPAMIDGQPIETEFALPIRFRLSNTGKNSSGDEAIVGGKSVNWLDEVQVVAYAAVKIPNADVSELPEERRVLKYEGKPTDPAVFVDGERMDGDVLKNLNPQTIESISVRKDSPEYPEGRIDIVLKKK